MKIFTLGLSTSIRQKAKDANEFVRVLDSHDLKQIAVGPTHELQGTLDLIITSIDHVSKMQDLQIGRKDEVCDSDHFSVAFSLDIEPIHQSKLTKIVKRDFSHLDKALFREEIGHQLSHIVPIVSNMDDCIKSYNCILEAALDKQCPLTEQNIRNRPRQKWYTPELREMKRKRRAAERKWKKQNTSSAKVEYNHIKQEYKQAVFHTRSSFTRDSINRNKNDPKKIHKTVKYITGQDQERILPMFTDKKELANEMGQYY